MAYSTDWKVVDPVIGTQLITDTTTTQNHPLGKRCSARDAGSNNNGQGTFIYLKGVASTVAGSVVLFQEDDYTTALLATGHIGQVAVAMSANVASQYGWYQVKGKAIAKVLAAFADDQKVFISATPGSVDDSSGTATDRIKQCKSASAIDTPATGMAELEIDEPFVEAANA